MGFLSYDRISRQANKETEITTFTYVSVILDNIRDNCKVSSNEIFTRIIFWTDPPRFLYSIGENYFLSSYKTKKAKLILIQI